MSASFSWSFERRFMRHVTITPGHCWEWTGSKMRNGYGQMGVGGKRYAAHRYAYEQLVSAIPVGLDLDHLCRNRACCNPSHLEPVTRSENLRRGLKRGEHMRAKTQCPHGHQYSPENTRITKKGSRCCRTCERIKAAKIRLEAVCG